MAIYPRNRRKIFCVGGIFDDFSDTAKSATKWTETWTGSNIAKTFPAAPGGVGGNSLRLRGTIGNSIGLDACGALSPFPNKSNMYYISPLNPYVWKMKAEFRMYIHEDEPDATNVLSHSAGFCLDGAVAWYSTYNQNRTYVLFNVSNQKVGIGTGTASGVQISTVYSEAWAGAVDTWYDVRIEWEHDFHADTEWVDEAGVKDLTILVTVYVNDVQLFSETITLYQWRENTAKTSYSVPLGRCGPSVVVENDGGATNGNYVDAYFKDVWITRDVKLIEYEFLNSILSKEYDNRFKGTLIAPYPTAINKGMDIQLYARNALADDFVGHFRGIIREAEVLPGKRLVVVEAEGYSSVLSGEKTENHAYTTQTAGYIINDIVNTPSDKFLFDTTTYFDSTTATYIKGYINLSKIDVLMEMASLESFILFIDEANNIHFQKHYTNETDIHLLYGRDKIAEFKLDETFIRQPNFLRVLGSGVSAVRQIAEDTFSNQSAVYRNINRLDLTTQAEVDAALDYYMSAFLEVIRVVELNLRANYKITVGKTIRVTIPPLELDNSEFLVLSVQSNNRSDMELKLLEVRPHTSILISELYERANLQEAQAFPSDDLTGEEVVAIEGVCDCFVNFFFAIQDPTGTCKIAGQGVVTDKGMAFFRDMWEDTKPNTIPRANWVALGDGTTPAKNSDNALDNELYRVATAIGDRAKDIKKVAGQTADMGVRIEIYNWGASQSFNCSEIGLFDAASSGNCFARAVFPTQVLNRNTARIWCWWKLTPKPGPVFMNYNFPQRIMEYLYSGGDQWDTPDMGGVFGTKTFTVPHFLLEEETETGGKVVITPGLASQMASYTQTKIAERFMFKIEWTYTFAYAERYFTGDGDAPVAWLGITKGNTNPEAIIQVWFRTDKLLSEYEGYFFHVIVWLRFLRGDIDPYRSYGYLDCPKP